MSAQKQHSSTTQHAQVPRSAPEIQADLDDVKLTAPLFGHECFEAVPRVDSSVRRQLPQGASTTLDTVIAGRDFASS
ncbi:hypothetical protein JDV02_005735 [Purpureocillium takamizusanense]|uniref:Uncharacterized protein n=1 Tax=Purpureocillium takamizusanense TaxID=2060973 RepID=A0A9Q8QH46_9HYPO|nr:uncharacterized protein JDV02_005735 [Purpureocillium takamizusanense]UNI19555.1 hypothetical protein JDV02_005735 [Purpureocillium takamizusanense]